MKLHYEQKLSFHIVTKGAFWDIIWILNYKVIISIIYSLDETQIYTNVESKDTFNVDVVYYGKQNIGILLNVY